jgi:hypothetical protein
VGIAHCYSAIGALGSRGAGASCCQRIFETSDLDYSAIGDEPSDGLGDGGFGGSVVPSAETFRLGILMDITALLMPAESSALLSRCSKASSGNSYRRFRVTVLS